MDKLKTFEDFLKDMFAQIYTGTDDDMPDAFDNFVSNLDGSDYLRIATTYGKECYLQGKTEVLNKVS